MHTRRCASLRRTSQVSRVSEHFGKRNKRRHDRNITRTRFHLVDLSAASVKIAVDGSHVLFRRNDFDTHDRLEQNRFCLFNSILKREFGVEANVGKPQVAYRETITAGAAGKEIYKKQSGGRGKFGHVELEIEPAPGEGFVFEDKITGGSIPRQFIKPTMEGVRDAMGRGFLAGYELVDIKVRLLFGSYHEVDSDEISFKLAGSFAFQDAVKKAKPILLEPIMRIEVVTPEEYMGAVNGDLNRRRGQIDKMEPRPGNVSVVTAFVPLSEMFGYTTDLRSSTQGRATSSMHFERYDEAPRNVAEEVIAKIKGTGAST